MYLGRNQILSQTRIVSELANKKVMQPDANQSEKKSVDSTLTLTSLVDMFTTILVYLLVASSFGSTELDTPKGMALPHAFYSTNLEDGAVLRVDHGQFFIGQKMVTLEHLVETLEQEKTKSDFLIIQSDKATRFSQLNPAVLAGLQSGFKQVRFAVLQEDEK